MTVNKDVLESLTFICKTLGYLEVVPPYGDANYRTKQCDKAIKECEKIRADLVPRQAAIKNEALEMQLQFLRQQYDGLVASNFKLSKKLAQRQAVTGDAHCEDCCCAKSWKALGITEYTGKSIPEHIEDLRGDNNILRLQRDAKMSSCGCNPAVPAEPTDKDAQLPSIEEVTEYFREHSPIGKAISSGELKVKVIPAEPTDKDAIAALNSIKEFIDHYSPTINTYDEEIETIRRALSAPAREGKLVEALNKLLDCEFEKVFRNAADVHRSYPAETKDAILNAREVLAAHDKETK